MRVIRDLQELSQPLHSSAVTIGNFDGVHLAHHALFERVVQSAQAIGGTAVAITFDPHPAKVLAPQRAPKALTPLDRKISLIEREGIGLLVILRFTRKLAMLSPEQFVDRILIGKLGAAVVHVGRNFRFGHQRAGDIQTLVALGQEKGFSVETLPMLTIRGELVSSTRIRQLLSEGRIGTACRMLGRTFSITEPIVTGEGVGHKLTVPTLNLIPDEEQQLPKNGVYVTMTRLGGAWYQSVTNIGYKPTFGPHRLGIESYLLDFQGAASTAEMEVEFLYRLRDEIKFPNPQALKQQIENDVRRSVKFFRLLEAMKKAQPRPATSFPV